MKTKGEKQKAECASSSGQKLKMNKANYLWHATYAIIET